MKIHEILEQIWDIFVLEKEMGYILFSRKINASHICPPKRNKLFEHRHRNRVVLGKNDFDM